MKPLIAPSLLSADFSRLQKEVKSVTDAGADWLHLDVMDGHFVPNLTFGPPLVSCVRKITPLTLDCHLMVENPEKWILPFRRAGADIITVHQEATKNLRRCLKLIKESGAKAGVSIRPATSVHKIFGALDLCDLVLVMSVNPGFGGQKFMPEVLEKAEILRQIRAQRKISFRIEIDGGIDKNTIGVARKSGCDTFVAGSAIFGGPNRKRSIQDLRLGLKNHK